MNYRDGFLLQCIIYCLLWMYDEYLGLLLSLVLACIFTALLIFALIAELIEKSKVPRSFFIWMLISIAPPVLVSLIFIAISGGNFYWLDEF